MALKTLFHARLPSVCVIIFLMKTTTRTWKRCYNVLSLNTCQMCCLYILCIVEKLMGKINEKNCGKLCLYWRHNFVYIDGMTKRVVCHQHWWSRPMGLYEPCPLLEWNGMAISADLEYCFPQLQCNSAFARQINFRTYPFVCDPNNICTTSIIILSILCLKELDPYDIYI